MLLGNKRSDAKSRCQGLTMTELVLVVITIGVIVALGVPQYQNVMTDARQKTAKLNLQSIKSAQDLYYDETVTLAGVHSYYPGPVAPTASLTNINSGLKLAITGDLLGYYCYPKPLNQYDCRAQYPASGSADWYCQITESLSEPTCL